MKRLVWLVVVSVSLAGGLWASEAVPVSHSQFQAVDATGSQIYTQDDRVVLEGIVLNNPADLLDPTPDDTITATGNLGGLWQVFIQGEGNDHAGTTMWMAQLYNNLPWIQPDGGYTNQQFIAELTRLNAAQFAPGDRVRITGLHLPYLGKNNINEQHHNDPDHDFTIELLARGVGLPRPEVVRLDQLKDAADSFIFDPNRSSGCEYYQGRLVKIPAVHFADPNWGPNASLLVTDGSRTFPVLLGRGNGIYAGSRNLTEPFDVIGIMDQEDKKHPDAPREGYRLWVPNYDGNGQVLASFEHRMADASGVRDQ